MRIGGVGDELEHPLPLTPHLPPYPLALGVGSRYLQSRAPNPQRYGISPHHWQPTGGHMPEYGIEDTGTITGPRYVVGIHYDQDTDNPNDWDGLLELVSFGTRHINYRDPREVFGCEQCGETAGDWRHKDVGGWVAAYRDEYGEDPNDEDREDLEGELHPFDPAYLIGALLNYYEHGLSRWYVAPAASPVDMQWDGVYGAGVIIVRDPEHWSTLDDETKSQALEAYAEEFTAWGNGECYGYVIERRNGPCACCGQELPPDEVDSCWGFIGGEYVASEIRRILADEVGVTPDELTAGEHYTVEGDGAYIL